MPSGSLPSSTEIPVYEFDEFKRGIADHARVATQPVFLVIAPKGFFVDVAARATFVIGQKWDAGLRLVGVDAVVGVPISHHLRIVTVLELVEIGCQRFDAAGANNQIRFILQDFESVVSAGRLPRHFVIEDDTVTHRQVGDAAFEFVEFVNRNFGAVDLPMRL